MVEKDSLMREIDDAIRQDRLMGLWNQFKMPLIYAAAALIIITAGSSIWEHYRKSGAEEIALDFDKAQQLYLEGKHEESAKAFEALSHQTRGDMADIVKLWRARSLLADGKKKTALRVLQNVVIAPEGRDLFWRDLACLHMMGLAASTAEFPESCTGKQASPLSALLAQMTAAGKWHEGDAKAARDILDAKAKDESLPAEFRLQAHTWDSVIRAHEGKE